MDRHPEPHAVDALLAPSAAAQAGPPAAGERAASEVELSPDPLAMLAVDANDLIRRIHSGQDLNHAVRTALAERKAA